ncbi:Cyclin-U4-1 [Ananas comosus]|uniref:Cyclin-U4-1 n=1 Tax=Ananas comosus TaxID=4615 RepID=A0A199VMJ5_ANACO|nr:Cyclin-U4-1 [Ananas comosus]
MTDLTPYPDSRERVIDFLTTYLEKVTKENDVDRPGTRLQERESVFDMMTKPRYAARAFVTRLPSRLPDCGARSFVVAYIYLSRFLRRQRDTITLDSFNVRRLLLTSLLTATKFELGL